MHIRFPDESGAIFPCNSIYPFNYQHSGKSNADDNKRGNQQRKNSVCGFSFFCCTVLCFFCFVHG